MSRFFVFMMAAVAVLFAGCAVQPTEEVCCGKPEVVYVDREVSECTLAVQRVTQVSPCAVCERFPVNARLASKCSVR